MSNKLINEDSPYLKQHSSNPVNWHTWGDEALDLAKKENKAIFVSIGYSSCHWCHVMERESFENEDIAKLLNDNFIAIKIDKEERPDIDKHFQEIYTKMNNKAGGWPLSIFITPNLVPIYSATYIPPIADYGLMGFKDLINTIVKSYNKDPQMLTNKGQEVLDALKPKSKVEATKIDDNIISIALNQIKQVYNSEFGGFSDRPKFPHTYTLNLAIDLYKLTKDDELKNIVEHTIDSMLLGGIYDIVDGGLCRYSTDQKWLVPHFEKMTYDNALFIETLLKAYEISDKTLYKDRANEIAEFMLEKMSKDKLFFSASNADTNKVEGEYFIYDYNTTKEAFEKSGVSVELLSKLNITENGNFDGSSIARLESIDLYEDSQIKEALKVLKGIRETKEYPAIDNKIITSWNCMMINALCHLAKDNSSYLDIAKAHLDALESKMVSGVIVYHSSLIKSTKRVDGFLEDYAWLTKAYLSYYEASLDEVYLIKATNLANEAVRKFYKNGRWVVGLLDFTNFSEDTDSTFTSSVAIMTQNLLSLRSLVEPIYEKFAFTTMQISSYKLMRQPIGMPTMTSAAIRHLKDDIIVKSNVDNLKKVVASNFKYPYTLLKVTDDNIFHLCNNKACFAQFNNIDELLENL